MVLFSVSAQDRFYLQQQNYVKLKQRGWGITALFFNSDLDRLMGRKLAHTFASCHYRRELAYVAFSTQWYGNHSQTLSQGALNPLGEALSHGAGRAHWIVRPWLRVSRKYVCDGEILRSCRACLLGACGACISNCTAQLSAPSLWLHCLTPSTCLPLLFAMKPISFMLIEV